MGVLSDEPCGLWALGLEISDVQIAHRHMRMARHSENPAAASHARGAGRIGAAGEAYYLPESRQTYLAANSSRLAFSRGVNRGSNPCRGAGLLFEHHNYPESAANQLKM
jgi:hypothetical protein